MELLECILDNRGHHSYAALIPDRKGRGDSPNIKNNNNYLYHENNQRDIQLTNCRSKNSKNKCCHGNEEAAVGSPSSKREDPDEKRIIKKEVKEDDDGDSDDQENPSTSSSSEEKDKPTLSYIALISMAILSSPQQKMLLSEIYSWIAKNFPYYKTQDRSWRNSIRHNLSLNECFIKAGRSENGKGNYWAVHHANVDDFGAGDFRRRRARRRVRQCNEELDRIRSGLLGLPQDAPDNNNLPELSCYADGYVAMTSTWATRSALADVFGVDVVFSSEERKLNVNNSYPNQELNAHVLRNEASTTRSECLFQSNGCSMGAPISTPAAYNYDEIQFVRFSPDMALNTPNFRPETRFGTTALSNTSCVGNTWSVC